MLDLSSSEFATSGTSLPRFSNSKPHERTEFIDDLTFSAGSDLDLLDTSSVPSSPVDDDDDDDEDDDDDDDDDDEDDDDDDDGGNDGDILTSLDDDVGSTRFSDSSESLSSV